MCSSDLAAAGVVERTALDEYLPPFFTTDAYARHLAPSSRAASGSR
ncbi:hypothetical protein ABT297_42895 [Dactylosporangium sp. NPDC000555]